MAVQPDASAPLPPGRAASGAAKLVVPSLIGALVALTLGVYGHLHHPTGYAINIAGFSSPGAVKSWLATGAIVFALVQVGSALVMYGKVPRIAAPSWIGGLHQWSGRIAFLLAVPVAVHCLYALGFQTLQHPGPGPLAARLRVLRRVHDQDADPAQARTAQLGAAGLAAPWCSPC